MRRSFVAFTSSSLAVVLALAACITDDPPRNGGTGSDDGGGLAASDGGISGGDDDPGNGGEDGGTEPPAPGQIRITATRSTVRRGKTADLVVTVEQGATAPEVTVKLGTLPVKISATGGTPVPAAGAEPKTTTVTFTLSAEATAPFGVFDVDVDATTSAGGPTAKGKASLLVRGAAGELDTSYGIDGFVAYTTLFLPADVVPHAARLHDGTLYLAGHKTKGLAVLAVAPNGTLDTTRFGAAKGVVAIDPPVIASPNQLKDVLSAPRLSIASNGAVVVQAYFSSETTSARVFATYSLPVAANAGTYAIATPTFNFPEFSLTESAIFPDGTGYLLAGITNAAGGTNGGAPAGRPYVARRKPSGEGPWSTGVTQKLYGTESGDTLVSPPDQIFAYSATPSDVVLSIVVIRSGKAQARVFVQPRTGAAHATYLLPGDLPAEPGGALAISPPNGATDAFVATALANGDACVFRLVGTSVPIQFPCRSVGASYVRGAFPVAGGKVALLTGEAGGKTGIHLYAADGKPAPGWVATEGGTVVPSGKPIFTVTDVVEDANEGLLVVEAASSNGGGGIRRIWN